MGRIDPADAIALGLALAAGALGIAAGTGALMPVLAAVVAAGGAVRAQTAQYLAILALVPLCALIGWGDPAFLAAVACLLGAALIWLNAARARPDEATTAVFAARVVLAGAQVVTASLLAAFAMLFVL